MRKNAINRELREISGGVCAPSGFQANAISCGIRPNGALDLALIATDRRCAAAGVYSTASMQGEPVLVTKKHLKRGYASAILANGGIANVYVDGKGTRTERMCHALDMAGLFSASEVIVASTGEIGKRVDFSLIEGQLKPLAKGLESSEEKGALFAQAISSDDSKAYQFSYGFDLGDIPCKIGGIYKGDLHVAPNMATTLVFLTTDVNITSEMLQKALSAETRETLNMLDLDGAPSPNDMACIMANGKAGNYIISCADTEYSKFCFVLRSVLLRICDKIIRQNSEKKPLLCKVRGVKSKQIARAIAKKVIATEALKVGVQNKEVDVKAILYTLLDLTPSVDLNNVSIHMYTAENSIALFEKGIRLSVDKERLAPLFQNESICLEVNLHMGNYSATAFGSVKM
ncbi:MAG: hypothetical protein E7364_03555 [Clostridiales bacterium]|nr:hypothetical protein [Clostridiales bacterium]